MPEAECATCEALRGRALNAMTKYYKFVGSSQLAKLSGDADKFAKLEPLLEEAGIERLKAMAEYKAHLAAHADGAKADRATA
jgi:hypothetical protein